MKMDCMKVIPRADLSRVLAEEQEAVLWGLKGDVFALIAGYKLACRKLLRTGKFPAYADLSRRLTLGVGRRGRSRMGARLDGRMFATICRRLHVSLRQAAESQLKFIPPKRDVFPEVQLERERRLVIYEKQIKNLDAIAASWSQAQRQGPKTKPIYCRDLKRWFNSAAEAARFINATTKGKISRSDIRTCIKRRCRVAGLRFSYDGPAEGKPDAKFTPSGTERPVICIELGEPAFPSRRKAAEFAGVSSCTMQNAIERGVKIGEFTYAYQEQKRPEKVIPPIDVPQLSYFVASLSGNADRTKAPSCDQMQLFDPSALEEFEPSEFGGAGPRRRKVRCSGEGQFVLFSA